MEEAADIHNGSTPGPRATTRRITPEPKLSCNKKSLSLRLKWIVPRQQDESKLACVLKHSFKPS